MGDTDKFENLTEEKVGESKETLGNDDLETEGKVDQTKANLKQAAEKVKDAFTD